MRSPAEIRNAPQHMIPFDCKGIMISHLTRTACYTAVADWHNNPSEQTWVLTWENVIFFKFIYLFWEREGGGEWWSHRERGKENPKQAPCCQQRSPMRGSISSTVRSWPELKPSVGCLTNWATQWPQKMLLFICGTWSDDWGAQSWSFCCSSLFPMTLWTSGDGGILDT